MSAGERDSPSSQDQKGTPIADEADLERQYQTHKKQFEEWKEKSKHLEGTTAYQQYVDQFHTWEQEVEKRRLTLRTRIAAQKASAQKKFEEAKQQAAAAAQRERDRVAQAHQPAVLSSRSWVNVSPPDNSPSQNNLYEQQTTRQALPTDVSHTPPNTLTATVPTREQAHAQANLAPQNTSLMYGIGVPNPAVESMNQMMNMMSQMMVQMNSSKGGSNEQMVMMMTTMMSMLMMDPSFHAMPQAADMMSMMNQLNAGNGSLMAEGPIQKSNPKKKRKLDSDQSGSEGKKKTMKIKEPTAPLPVLSADYGYGGGRGIWGNHDNLGTSRDPMYHKWGLRAAPAGSAPIPEPIIEPGPLPFPLPPHVPPPPGWVGGQIMRKERRLPLPPTEYREGRPGLRDFSMR